MNCVATIAMHDRLSKSTKSSNRMACSHSDGDGPRGDLLRLTATSSGTFSFEAMTAAVSLASCAAEGFDGGGMVVDAVPRRVSSNVPERWLRLKFGDMTDQIVSSAISRTSAGRKL
jgi:hypothetical protein